MWNDVPSLDFSLLADQLAQDDIITFSNFNEEDQFNAINQHFADLTSSAFTIPTNHLSPPMTGMNILEEATKHRIIAPDLAIVSNGCKFCESALFSHNLARSVAGSYSFKCTIRSESQISASSFHFNLRNSSVLIEYDLDFKNCDADLICEAIQGNVRNCFVFPVDSSIVVHVMCLTPLAERGSLCWFEYGRFLGFEGGMKFSIEVYSSLVDLSVSITPNSPPGILSDIKRTGSQASSIISPAFFGKHPNQLLGSAIQFPTLPESIMSHQSLSSQNPYITMDISDDNLNSKHDVGAVTESLAQQSGAKRKKRSRSNSLSHPIHLPESLCLTPVVIEDSDVCEACTNTNTLGGDFVVISSYSFCCGLMSGPKNLRQKAHSFHLLRNGRNSTGEFSNFSHSIRFKIYADSTIRRGKRSLRRNCALFKLNDHEFLHIACNSGFSGRGSLKWTEEKQERFLAFESELGYGLQIVTKKQAIPSDVVKKTKIEPIIDFEFRPMIKSWKNDLPEENVSTTSEPSAKAPTQQNSQPLIERGIDNLSILSNSATPAKLQSWQLEPNVWNMTLNSEETFFASVISNEKLLPLTPPMIIFSLRDFKVETFPVQYDRKNRRSFIISVPRMISKALIQDAFNRSVKISRIVDVSIVDETGKKLWHTTFLFEAGLEARGTHLPRFIDHKPAYLTGKFNSPLITNASLPNSMKNLKIYIEIKEFGIACAFEVDSDDKISNFKRRVQDDDYINLPPKQQRLMYKGVELEDSSTFGSYKICNGDLISLQQRIYDYLFLKKVHIGVSSLFSLHVVESSSKLRYLLMLFNNGTPKSKRNEIVSSVQSWSLRFPLRFLKLVQFVRDEIDSTLPLCIVFEYTQLETLDQFLSLRAKSENFPLSQVLKFAEEILNTLKELHHEDVCVSNLSSSSFFVFKSEEKYSLKVENFYNTRANSNFEKSVNMLQIGRILYQIMTVDLEMRSLEEMNSLIEEFRGLYKGLVDVVKALLDAVDMNRPSAIQSLQAIAILNE